jgi:Suppressor of fused protein (SUFU)
MEEPEQSPGGSRIYRHGEPGDPPPGEQSPFAEAIEAHVERHIGPIGQVFHELVSEYAHIDVLHVPPREGRPVHTLVTCGMSARPMNVPDGSDVPRLAELIVGMRPEWPIHEDAFRDERHYWPVRLIKTLARLPHAYDTHLAIGHTIPNGDPPEPYAPGTRLCCAMIDAPLLLLPSGAEVLETDQGPLHFYGVVALHRDEMERKLEQGYDALVEPLEAARVTEVVEPDRPSSLPRRKRFGVL